MSIHVLGKQWSGLLHGTGAVFSPGDIVSPAEVAGVESPSSWDYKEAEQYAHATTHPSTAASFAFFNADHRETPRVYGVEPVDPSDVRSDPYMEGEPGSNVRSRAGFRVVGEATHPFLPVREW